MLDTTTNRLSPEITYSTHETLYKHYAEMWGLIPDSVRFMLDANPTTQLWSLELARRVRDHMNYHGQRMEDAYDRLNSSSKDAA